MVIKHKIDGYDLPNVDEVVIDTKNNEVVDQAGLSPIEFLKLAAEKAKITILDPNPDCDKCYGRGYTAMYSGTPMPVACKCIFPPEEWEKAKYIAANNRRNRKKLVDINQRNLKRPKMQKIVEMGLKQIDKETYKNKNGKFFVWDGENFVKKGS